MDVDYTKTVTKELAVDAGANGGTFYHRTIRLEDGRAASCRANGKCKTWKTRPGFRLPVKHGWVVHITETNCKDWLLHDPTSPSVLLAPFRTSDVVRLAARGWWDESLAPVLADALQDAGYADEKVLANMRSGKKLTLTPRYHDVLSYLLPDDFNHSGPPCPKCGVAMEPYAATDDHGNDVSGYACPAPDCSNNMEPTCSSDPGTGEVYNCTGPYCPKHGERNRTLTPQEVA